MQNDASDVWLYHNEVLQALALFRIFFGDLYETWFYSSRIQYWEVSDSLDVAEKSNIG